MIPRQNGKSTLLLNCLKLQQELKEANYKHYAERVKNDLLKRENKELKELLKDLRELIGNNFVSSEMRKILLEVDEVLKND